MHRLLDACAAPSEGQRLLAVVAGSEADARLVEATAAEGDREWAALGPPLLRAAEMLVHASTRDQAGAAGEGGRGEGIPPCAARRGSEQGEAAGGTPGPSVLFRRCVG